MQLVYAMQFSNRVKVGYTTDFKTRKTSIQTALKEKASRFFSTPASIEAEALAHQKLEPFRIQGEYYSCPFDQACSAIKDAVEEVGVPVEEDSKRKVKFTLVLPYSTTKKLDYIRAYYGRSRIKEIEWACKEWIARFEAEHGKITQEDLRTLRKEAGE